jgi:choline dehydrogenase-like flavoprotein
MTVEPGKQRADLNVDDFQPDVIVVGSGSAGAAAARRLVDHGDVCVLLLEAGGIDSNPAIHDPGRLHEVWPSEDDWGFETVPQRHALGRRLVWPRGRVLGGSSSINGMIWVRGHSIDYDNWAYLGNEGWGWNEVRPVFERIERHEGSDEGIVTILESFEPDPIHRAFIKAGRECGLPFNENYNDGDQDGISYQQFNIKDRMRHGTASAYLAPIAGHPNLRVLLNAQAHKLMLDGARCVGVEWEKDGKYDRCEAPEVVLASGTLGSPRILLLSGIGPADELAELGIDVAVDLPGVGSNLHDHLLSPVIFAADREIGPPSPGLPTCQTHSFARSRPGLVVPDIQPIHFMTPMYQDSMQGPENGFTLMGGIVRPASRGKIRLSGSSPKDPLLLDPNILSCQADLDSLVASVELVRQMGRTSALAEWGARELYPGPALSDPADLTEYVRGTAITYHHQAGTCKMGIDADAVVDPLLRVRGVDGLRVADASIMPAVITGNTNAPSMMIGERVADFITASTPAGVAVST